jgi:hypothetical protein
MRYNPPLQRTTEEIQSWVGRTVRDTHERVGTVTLAWREPNNVVGLRVEMFDGYEWMTDSEHATIVRVSDGSN